MSVEWLRVGTYLKFQELRHYLDTLKENLEKTLEEYTTRTEKEAEKIKREQG